jgi:hypothetical protein
MVRTLTGLQVVDDDLALRGVRIGTLVQVEVVRPRNLKHHRLYWAMIGRIADAIDEPRQAVHDHLCIVTGHYYELRVKGGIRLYPKSVSFASMDQAAFREHFDRCCRAICEEWLPHMTGPQLRKDVLQMMGISWKQKKDSEALASEAPRAVSEDRTRVASH